MIFCVLPAPEQYRVAIELTARDSKTGQRIERVVFDDTDQPSWPHNAPHLTHETRPFRRRDVMHDADRGDQIEAGIGERKDVAVEGPVVDIGVVDLCLRNTGGGCVYAAELTDHAAQQWMEAANAAADIEHVRLF